MNYTCVSTKEFGEPPHPIESPFFFLLLFFQFRKRERERWIGAELRENLVNSHV